MSGPATMNCRPTTTSAAPLPAPKLPGAPEGPLDLRAPLPLRARLTYGRPRLKPAAFHRAAARKCAPTATWWSHDRGRAGADRGGRAAGAGGPRQVAMLGSAVCRKTAKHHLGGILHQSLRERVMLATKSFSEFTCTAEIQPHQMRHQHLVDSW